MSLENDNENDNENENANGHAAIQEGVVVVLLHHHHHRRRHSTLFIFRHSAPTRRSPFSSLSPVQVGVFGSSSSSSPMVYSKDSCIALMLSPVRVRSFTGFSRVVPIMITACGNSDFPDIQILHEGIPIKSGLLSHGRSCRRPSSPSHRGGGGGTGGG